MVVTLKKPGDSFTFTLPPQVVEDLALVGGSTVTIEPQTPTIRYATKEEALAAYEATRPECDGVYRELAK